MNIDRADNFIASLGVEAYRVGGSVRDEILGRPPKDADYIVRGVDLYTLYGKLAAKRTIRRESVKITPLEDRRGQQFGWRYGQVEIALPRREENAGAGRAQVIVADPNITLYEDAKRRDFTFNALYAPIPRTEYASVIDPTGRGLYDLQRGMIQTTHPDSFRDDPLRMLRALRFMARGFSLTTETLNQMYFWENGLDGLTVNGFTSGTVLDEMSKILMGENVAETLRVARDTNVLATLFPELDDMIGFDQGSRYHDMTTDEHTIKALAMAAAAEAPLRVRWALLFHDSGKPETAWMGKDGRLHYYEPSDALWAELSPEWTPKPEDHAVAGERRWRQAAERIGAPKDLREDVATIIRNHMVPLNGGFRPSKVRRGRVKYGDAMLRDLYLHRACDINGKGKVDTVAMKRIAEMELTRREAQKAGVPCKVGDLAINGHTLQAMGIQGKEIGRVLRLLLDEVACQPSEKSMDPDWQMQRAVSIAQEGPISKAVSNRG